MATYLYNDYLRLYPKQQDTNLQVGFEAQTADPLWFLARQWQMGEHQGENATTPVLMAYNFAQTPIEGPRPDELAYDPTHTPLEAILESEHDDWWTMGRRVRVGAAIAARPDFTDLARDAKYQFTDPPPPYEHLMCCYDGLALWRAHTALGLNEAWFTALGVPAAAEPYFWNAQELVYETSFGFSENQQLTFPRHRGGNVDWHSADAAEAEAWLPDVPAEAREAYPVALQYPGAPNSRWWQIENAKVDIGGYPPDASHFATSLLIDIISSHSDDWFIIPVQAQAGHILTLTDGVVTDSFGRVYSLQRPPDAWSIFSTQGLPHHSMLLFLRAVNPLEGETLEDVLLGWDEYSNMLWGVEQRIDGRDVQSQAVKRPPATGFADLTAGKNFLYQPNMGLTPHWHPYEVEDITLDASPERFLVQRRVADLKGDVLIPRANPCDDEIAPVGIAGTPHLMPAARAEVLRLRDGALEQVHLITPATVPSTGMQLQRRWMLARDTSGDPVLWVQRQRKPLRAGPSRAIRYDVLEEVRDTEA